ncbi:MAG: HpcH/HpaI aldolase family protein [Acidimicrobiia bacterium]
MTSLREKWAAGDETLGLWLSTPTPLTAELTARQPVDYVCVDTQHGIADVTESILAIQAVELTGGTPIVRVPWNEPGVIGRMLDAGAHGVIVPMVNTREQAEAVVRAVRYAPDGARSWGPAMSGMRHPDHLGWAAANVAAIAMIETAEALSNLDDIVSTPGIDAVYVGPADLSLSLGLAPGNNDGDPVFDDALATIVAACHRHGVAPGVHATGAVTPRRREQGFRMITVASDVTAVRAGYASELDAARGDPNDDGPSALY